MKKADVETIARSLYDELLPRSRLVRVVVRESEVWDGDEVLDIFFVLKKGKKLDSRKTIELTRRMRSKLVESDEERWPITGFVLEEDVGDMGVAT